MKNTNNNFQSYPNQKIIRINEDARHEETPFAKITHRELQIACNLLNGKGAALTLYLYCVRNADNHKFALSKVALEKYAGIKKDAYFRAIEVLKETGYLVQHGEGNIWDFYRIPYDYTEESKSSLTNETVDNRSSLTNAITSEDSSLVCETANDDSSRINATTKTETIAQTRLGSRINATGESHERDYIVSRTRTEDKHINNIDNIYTQTASASSYAEEIENIDIVDNKENNAADEVVQKIDNFISFSEETGTIDENELEKLLSEIPEEELEAARNEGRITESEYLEKESQKIKDWIGGKTWEQAYYGASNADEQQPDECFNDDSGFEESQQREKDDDITLPWDEEPENDNSTSWMLHNRKNNFGF